LYRSAGDPGFLGNLFRGVTHVIGGAVGGLIKSGGNPIGGIIGAVKGTAGAIRVNTAASIAGADATAPIGSSAQGTPHPHYVPGVGVVSQRGAHHVYGKVVGHAGTGMVPGGATMQLSDVGGMSMNGGGGGRRRRMRWTNVKALGRAERRISSAVKHMTKYVRWVHPTKTGHLVPRFKRGKKR
jgi:hypothetical protein